LEPFGVNKTCLASQGKRGSARPAVLNLFDLVSHWPITKFQFPCWYF